MHIGQEEMLFSGISESSFLLFPFHLSFRDAARNHCFIEMAAHSFVIRIGWVFCFWELIYISRVIPSYLTVQFRDSCMFVREIAYSSMRAPFEASMSLFEASIQTRWCTWLLWWTQSTKFILASSEVSDIIHKIIKSFYLLFYYCFFFFKAAYSVRLRRILFEVMV